MSAEHPQVLPNGLSQPLSPSLIIGSAISQTGKPRSKAAWLWERPRIHNPTSSWPKADLIYFFQMWLLPPFFPPLQKDCFHLRPKQWATCIILCRRYSVPIEMLILPPSYFPWWHFTQPKAQVLTTTYTCTASRDKGETPRLPQAHGQSMMSGQSGMSGPSDGDPSWSLQPLR